MNKEFYEDQGISFGIEREVYFQLANNVLIEKSVQMGQGKLSKDGALVVKTGKHTGRSAKDKYVVKTATTEESIWWDNALNPMTTDNFSKLKKKVLDYLNGRRDLFVTERSVGAHEKHNIGCRLITTHPHHALFSKHLFREKYGELNDKAFTILHAPDLVVDPIEFGTKSGTVVTTCFDTNTTIICGTAYAGEIKKSMFCVMNYLLPEENILPMHSGSNHLKNGECSVFFGLSGTGKTTLSTDEGTLLVGDDEHGLSDEGVFNFEGGCYAKTYQLSAEKEPGIYKASNRFGAICENVVMNEENGVIDFDDKSLSENGRSSYPLEFIEGLEKTSKGDVPKHIFFLTADAFGVLPPVSSLTKEQAMFYFVLGYTAKLAGTEIGVKEPQATFSCCFGGPFMLRHPSEYAKLLGEFLDKHKIKVWLVNTGWTGGVYGVGERFPLRITREIIRAIQRNEINETPIEKDPIFGLGIPRELKEIPAEILNPQKSWANQKAYVEKANSLAASFHSQMRKFGDFYDDNIEGSPLFGRTVTWTNQTSPTL
jgi:phosphoenolpyruvate carboxykinase (ATP)